ncbi:MAG: 30S ribosome-binding factor RbfA, partial [Chloroflexi bacterium]|nr:30S ribosome-binding factor RbfA [Chloroflexota bacterium]
MSRRIERLNALFRQELSNLLQQEVWDPRYQGLTTITRVEISSDLRHAKIFVSVMAEESAKKSTLTALKSATRFLRRRLSERVVLRTMPELQFIEDDS